MGVLIAGLVLFLGIHSVRIFRLREPFNRALGAQVYMVVYALISAAGLALIIYGKILAHPSAALWAPPGWTRFAPLIVTPIALVLIASAYLPGRLRSLIRHPMTLGLALWSGSHLMANGDTASVVMFAAILVWSVLLAVTVFAEGGGYDRPGSLGGDAVALGAGLTVAALTAVFHMQLFGVAVIELASDQPPSGI
ncbi:MAG: NnrU family protein [Pseudomonadota bacterium]